MDQEYLEYAAVLILSILGAASAYFINLSRPETFASLLLIPVLYSYTAYISREEFNYATLAALVSMFFTILGGITAVTAVFYSLGPMLVSYFTSGERIKDFYSSTSLPMLIIGLTIGAAVFVHGTVNPAFQDDLKQDVSQKIGEMTSTVTPAEQLLEQQKRAQLKLVNKTSDAAFNLTVRELRPDPNQDLNAARNSVRDSIYDNAVEEMDKDVNVSEKVENQVETQIEGLNFVFVIPIVTGFIYSLQPIVGLLTALFGSLILAGEGLFHRLKDHAA